MTVSSDVVFRSGLDLFGSVVDRMPSSAWSEASPCAGWTALDVLGHLGRPSGSASPSSRVGPTTGPPSTDRPTWWTALPPTTGPPSPARHGPPSRVPTSTPPGRRRWASARSPRASPSRPSTCFVHAWDIGRAGGIAVEVPDDVIEFAHAYLDPIPAGQDAGRRAGRSDRGGGTGRRHADRGVHRLDRARPAVADGGRGRARRSPGRAAQAAGLPLPATGTSATAPASLMASTSTEAAPTSPAAS